MTRIAIGAAMVSIAITLVGAIAETLSPSPVFEGSTRIPSKNGTTQLAHITVQSWGIAGRSGVTHEIPLRGFYVAHLVSGRISTTIDGQISKRQPGDYWAVKAGVTMQVKLVGEIAVLETTVVAKQ